MSAVRHLYREWRSVALLFTLLGGTLTAWAAELPAPGISLADCKPQSIQSIDKAIYLMSPRHAEAQLRGKGYDGEILRGSIEVKKPSFEGKVVAANPQMGTLVCGRTRLVLLVGTLIKPQPGALTQVMVPLAQLNPHAALEKLHTIGVDVSQVRLEACGQLAAIIPSACDSRFVVTAQSPIAGAVIDPTSAQVQLQLRRIDGDFAAAIGQPATGAVIRPVACGGPADRALQWTVSSNAPAPLAAALRARAARVDTLVAGVMVDALACTVTRVDADIPYFVEPPPPEQPPPPDPPPDPPPIAPALLSGLAGGALAYRFWPRRSGSTDRRNAAAGPTAEDRKPPTLRVRFEPPRPSAPVS